MAINPKQQVSLIILSTILSSFSFASIINFTDPNSTSLSTFIFFYLSLFIVFLGLFSLIGLAIRQKFNKGHYVENLSQSFRQALFISILLIVSFILISKNLLFWWVEVSIILLLLTIEFFLNLKV